MIAACFYLLTILIVCSMTMTMKLFEFWITSGPPVVTLAVDGMPQILQFSEFCPKCKKSQLQLIWQLEKYPRFHSNLTHL